MSEHGSVSGPKVIEVGSPDEPVRQLVVGPGVGAGRHRRARRRDHDDLMSPVFAHSQLRLALLEQALRRGYEVVRALEGRFEGMHPPAASSRA